MQFGKEPQLLILVHRAKAVLGSYDYRYLGTGTITTIKFSTTWELPVQQPTTAAAYTAF